MCVGRVGIAGTVVPYLCTQPYLTRRVARTQAATLPRELSLGGTAAVVDGTLQLTTASFPVAPTAAGHATLSLPHGGAPLPGFSLTVDFLLSRGAGGTIPQGETIPQGGIQLEYGPPAGEVAIAGGSYSGLRMGLRADASCLLPAG